MAKLVYDDTGRLLFTKEMKEEYTILMPQMLPVHFGMFQRLLELEGLRPACLIAMGYPEQWKNGPGRRETEELLSFR